MFYPLTCTSISKQRTLAMVFLLFVVYRSCKCRNWRARQADIVYYEKLFLSHCFQSFLQRLSDLTSLGTAIYHIWQPYYLLHLKYPSIQLFLSALFKRFWNLPIRIRNGILTKGEIYLRTILPPGIFMYKERSFAIFFTIILIWDTFKCRN